MKKRRTNDALIQSKVIMWLRKPCWTEGEALMLLNGWDVRSAINADSPSQPDAGIDVDTFKRATNAGQIRQVGVDENGEPTYAPADVIAFAKANNIGNWQAWFRHLFTPEDREGLSRQSHWSERELEALCLGIPPREYSDASVGDDERESIRLAIRQACTNGILLAVESNQDNHPHGGQWQIERVSGIRWALSEALPWLPDWLASHDLMEIYKRQDDERRAVGRYSLWEAANEISRHTGENANGLLKELEAAVAGDVLPVYEPGKNLRYRPTRVREFHDEAYWNDLNRWMDDNQRRIPWRFPQPVNEQIRSSRHMRKRFAGHVDNSYLAFPKAMKLLADRLGATVEEIAAWIFMGPDHGGIAAYRNANELEAPPRFCFDHYMGDDYVAPMMACWFLEEDIERFIPENRFMTGKALIERWGKQSGIKVEAFIKAKIAESRLIDLYPTYGGTRGTNSEEASLPPWEAGLFALAEVEAIEAEDFGNAYSGDQPNPSVGSPEWRKRNAKAAAEALHSRPGGSREKRGLIQAIWASGKYSSRDRCAEEECRALDMAPSTARNALKNLPKPPKKN